MAQLLRDHADRLTSMIDQAFPGQPAERRSELREVFRAVEAAAQAAERVAPARERVTVAHWDAPEEQRAADDALSAVTHEFYMGWRLHRLWSTEWFRDPEAAISDVLRSVELAEREPVERSIEAPRKAFIDLVVTPHSDKPGGSSEQPTRAYGPGVPYQRYSGRSRDRRDLLEGARRQSLTATLKDIVKVEWPVMDEVLLERLREVHGVGRAGDNIRENFDRALNEAQRQKSISIDFETPGSRVIGSPDAFVTRFRIPGDDVQRSIEEIPKVEIALAALHLVEDQFGMQRDAIPARIANIFGFSRARAPSADRIREVIDELIEAGRLRTQGPNLYLV